MDIWFFLPVLFLLTMLAGIVFALVSKSKVDQRRQDPNAPKSTLAADASSHGKPADV